MAEEKKPEGEKATKKKTTGAAAMAEETKPEPEKAPRKKLTKAEKQAQHTVRLKRMVVACIAGILSGLISFVVDSTGTPAGTALGILLVLAAVVFQKYVFFALRMDYLGLTAKDWVFQGFMTLAFWFITWTILLSSA
jgi:lysozyme family protein